MSREISVVVKEGGSDPAMNAKLRDLISKAKANNVPNENIERAIKKAAGEGDKNQYETIVYEGYGPQGVAVIVETLTDNRNRTAGEVRHYFDKFGGNMGTTGCVSFLFEEKGIIILEKSAGMNDEKLYDDAIDVGVGDIEEEEEVYILTMEPSTLRAAREGLGAKGYTLLSAETEKIPDTTVTIEDPDTALKMSKLLEMMEENDDVQNVWNNWENPLEN